MQRADTIKTNLLPTLESEKIIASQTSLKKPEGVSYASIDYGPLMVCSFQQLAATIALWRISMLVADSADKMDNIMNRLIKDAIPDMLRPYGVDKKVIEMIEDMQRAYKQWLRPSD